MPLAAPTTTSADVHSVPGRRTRNAIVSAGSLRTWHSNVSAFIAPMVIFFALSGASQILGLHEAHGNYKPSAVISSIARLHKQQVFAPEPPRKPPAWAQLRSTMRPPSPDMPPITLSTVLLKAFFLLESLALVTTTVLGAWIGVTHAKRARTCWLLLAAGTLIPLILSLTSSG